MSDVPELLNIGLLSDSNGVGAATRDLLASQSFAEFIKYEEDKLLLAQGSEPDSVYFTISGLFHAVSHANEQTPQRLLGRIEPGQFIGEVSLLDSESTASASVKAMKDAQALRMSRKAFGEFCKAHPEEALEFVTALAKGLAIRLRGANEKVL